MIDRYRIRNNIKLNFNHILLAKDHKKFGTASKFKTKTSKPTSGGIDYNNGTSLDGDPR